MKQLLLALSLLLSLSVISQGIKISNNPGVPDPSAGLELDFTNKGFLLPRLTTTQRNAIVSPAMGLQVFNTTTQCIEAYFNSGWKKVACDCNGYPNGNYTFSPNSPGINSNATFHAIQGGTATYAWTFQSGNPATSTIQNPVIQWSSPGTYAVTLTVTDSAGCSSNSSGSITVINCPNGSQTFNYTGGMQSFTVPNCVTSLVVETWGAQGGSINVGCVATGGRGAYIKGTVSVTPGEVISILVGGQGQTNGSDAGGGGGSFVVRTGNVPLVIAGGGGGASNNIGSCGTNLNGLDASTSQNGTASANGQAAGGTGGNGGTNVGGGSGGGGGGFTTNGGNYPRGGTAYISGGQGGTGLNNNNGGYGGGGCGWHTGGNGGGGGGYSGGGTSAAQPFTGGGGGGSYNIGTNQTNTAGVQTGNGKVTISW